MTTVIAGNPHRGLQQRKARRDSWTPAKRAAFLARLEETCNVRMGCEAAGLGKDAAYGLRQRDGAFAADWSAAIEQGCEELRRAMLARALGTADPPDAAVVDAIDAATAARLGVPETAPMSDEMRLKTLQICRASAEGRQGRRSWRRDRAPAMSGEEAFASLATKLERMERKLKRDGK